MSKEKLIQLHADLFELEVHLMGKEKIAYNNPNAILLRQVQGLIEMLVKNV